MSEDFTTEELIKCLEPTEEGYECGIDEVLMLLADFIEDKRVHDLIHHYVDNFYSEFDESLEYIRGLEKRIEKLEGKLKYGKRRNKEG